MIKILNTVIWNGELNTYHLRCDPLSYYWRHLCKIEGMPSSLRNVSTTIDTSQWCYIHGLRGFGRVHSEVNIWASISTGRNAGVVVNRVISVHYVKQKSRENRKSNKNDNKEMKFTTNAGATRDTCNKAKRMECHDICQNDIFNIVLPCP